MSFLSEPARQKRLAEILSLYEAGMTLHAIGVRFGLTRERIRQIVKKAGVAMPQDVSKARHDAIAEAICQGLTKKEVVTQFGVSGSFVGRVAHMYGVKINRRPASEETFLAQAVQEVAQGKSARSLSGGSLRWERAILARCEKAGVASKHGPHRDLSHRIETVRRLYSDGHSWASIAAQLSIIEGRPLRQIYTWAQNHMDLPPRHSVRRKPRASKPRPGPTVDPRTTFNRAASIREACVANRGKMSARQLAEILGTTRNAVIGHWFRARQAGAIT